MAEKAQPSQAQDPSTEPLPIMRASGETKDGLFWLMVTSFVKAGDRSIERTQFLTSLSSWDDEFKKGEALPELYLSFLRK